VPAYRLAADPTIGYLLLPDFFSGNRPRQVDAALLKLLSAPPSPGSVPDPPLQGIVLDLRNNPGGQIPVMKKVLGDFMQGEAGAHYFQKTQEPLTIAARPLQGRLAAVPVVILVNESTGSGAEVIS